jgi:hypothetical protein
LQVTPRDLSMVVSAKNFSFIWKQNGTPVRMLSYCLGQRSNTMMMVEVFTCQPQTLHTQQKQSDTATQLPPRPRHGEVHQFLQCPSDKN